MLTHNQHIFKSPTINIELCQCTFRVAIALTESTFVFLHYVLEKLQAWLGIGPITIDLIFLSGTYDLSVTASPWLDDSVSRIDLNNYIRKGNQFAPTYIFKILKSLI